MSHKNSIENGHNRSQQRSYMAPRITVVSFVTESGFAGSTTPLTEAMSQTESYQYEEANDNLNGYF